MPCGCWASKSTALRVRVVISFLVLDACIFQLLAKRLRARVRE